MIDKPIKQQEEPQAKAISIGAVGLQSTSLDVMQLIGIAKAIIIDPEFKEYLNQIKSCSSVGAGYTG